MALQNPIPLLQFFRHYQPTGGLQPLARDCTLREIRLHPADRSADLVASFSVVPDPRSLRALETVLAIYASMRAAGPVDLPLSGFGTLDMEGTF